ncbi:recombinase family protein, partial [bacterium]
PLVFAAMLSQIKRESVACLLVEKTDRLYRNLHDYVKVDDIVDVEVHLIKEGEVLSAASNSDKHFMHGIRVLMARKYSMNLREETMKGMLQKARDGVWPTKAPLGYLNVTVESRKVIQPDPERAPKVRAMIERYAKGDVSIAQTGEYAHALGLTTRKGKRLARCEVHAILRSKAYIGVVTWQGEEHPGIHEPLVDQATWVRCQRIMEGRNLGHEQPASAREHVYKGMFRCGRCGCLISAQTTKGKVYYACTGAKGCKRVGVREEAITAAIAERLRGVTIRPEVLGLLKEALKGSLDDERALREERVGELESRRKTLKANLEQLYADRLTETVPLSVL